MLLEVNSEKNALKVSVLTPLSFLVAMWGESRVNL